jgi:hypothetical protein
MSALPSIVKNINEMLKFTKYHLVLEKIKCNVRKNNLMGCLGRATCTVQFISASDRPERKQVKFFMRSLVFLVSGAWYEALYY